MALLDVCIIKLLDKTQAVYADQSQVLWSLCGISVAELASMCFFDHEHVSYCAASEPMYVDTNPNLLMQKYKSNFSK